MHYPLTDIQADFEINRLIRYQITEKRNYLHRQTDGRTDGRTDVAYDNNRFPLELSDLIAAEILIHKFNYGQLQDIKYSMLLYS